MSRRGVVIGVGACAALGVLGGLRYVGHNPVMRPPGGQDEKHLVSACIRCEKCYEACPRKVIMPSHIEDGLLGMRSPQLQFDDSYCDYCVDEYDGVPHCVQVCPTGALHLDDAYWQNLANESLLGALEIEAQDCSNGNVISSVDSNTSYDGQTRKRPKIALGKAEIDTYKCLAYRSTGCRKCYDKCPYGAIDLDQSDSANPKPLVNTELCNGCGACEAVCESNKAGAVTGGTDVRAIVVKSPYELV